MDLPQPPRRAAPSSRLRHAVVAATAILGLTASGLFVWRGTEAVFSATTENGPNSFSTAAISLSDDDSGGVAFNATNLAPGSTGTQCITVSYTSTIQANGVRLYATSYSDTGGLAAAITLTVTEGSGGSWAGCAAPTGTSIYNGTLAAFGTTRTDYATGVYVSGAGAWQPIGTAQTKVYRIGYTVGSSAPMSASSTLTFTWEAQAGT